jgi:hypothetical protein
MQSTAVINYQIIMLALSLTDRSEIRTVNIHRLFSLLFPVWAALE